MRLRAKETYFIILRHRDLFSKSLETKFKMTMHNHGLGDE